MLVDFHHPFLTLLKRSNHKLSCYRLLICLFLFGLFTPGFSETAQAKSVEVEVIKEEAIVGEKLAFALHFHLEDEKEVIDVSEVKYNGAAIPYEVNSRSSSSFTMIVNGKTIQSSSDIIRSYIFKLTADTEGDITLPPFKVSLGDETYATKPLSFQVRGRPTTDDLQFLVAVNHPQEYYYPSQVIELDCRILYRNFPGSPAINNISLPILKDRNFQLLPTEDANLELIVNDQRIHVRGKQGRQRLNGKQYDSLEFNLKFRLMQPGTFQFANFIKLTVETGRQYRQRSMFFGYDIVKETKPVFADSPILSIQVLELPTQGVPPSFNGAIGEFKIKVTPSSDTAIKVGDPITLLIEIAGRGTWEFVKSPPLHKDPQITDYFIVSQEAIAGEVDTAGTTKSFSVRLRVKSKTVSEIPSIPFTYFNLATRKYVTVYSDPVPIQVFGSSTTAKITDFNQTDQEDNVSSDTTKTHETTNKKDVAVPAPELPLKQTGPALPPLIQIADNVPYNQTTKNHAPVYKHILIAFGSFGAVFILFVFRLYQGRDISAEKDSTKKAKKAYKTFQREVEKLDTKTNMATYCRDLGTCLHRLIEERFICTLAHIDDDALKPLVDKGQMSNETAQQLIAIIDKIDQYRYGHSNTDDIIDSRKILKETIEALQQCDL